MAKNKKKMNRLDKFFEYRKEITVKYKKKPKKLNLLNL